MGATAAPPWPRQGELCTRSGVSSAAAPTSPVRAVDKGERVLVLGRLGEEAPRVVGQRPLQLGGDAMAGDVERADLRRGRRGGVRGE